MSSVSCPRRQIKPKRCSEGLNATGPSPLQVGLRPLHALCMTSIASRLGDDRLGMNLDAMGG
jgi:hypothetical protein